MALHKVGRGIILIVLAFLFFIMMKPCYVWGYEWPRKALIAFCVIMIIISSPKGFKIHNPFLLFILVFLCIKMVALDNLLSFTAFLLIPLLIFPDDEKMIVYHYIIRLYAAFMAISIIVYILVVWVGVSFPGYYLSPANLYKEHDYIKYPFMVMANDLRHPEEVFRFYSVFDEAGVVGTLAAIFLWIENYKLRKWYNLIIFISGLLSFSLFFIVISLFYFAVVFKEIVFQWKNLLLLALISMALSLSYIYLKDNTDIDAVVDRFVLSRFQFDDGEWSGNNRSTDHFDRVYSAFVKEGNDVMFGKGIGAHTNVDPGVQTYKMMIFDYGLVFVVLSLLFFIIYGYCVYKRVTVYYILYIVLLFGFYYQRPAFLFSPEYFYLFLIVPLNTKKLDKNGYHVKYRNRNEFMNSFSKDETYILYKK